MIKFRYEVLNSLNHSIYIQTGIVSDKGEYTLDLPQGLDKKDKVVITWELEEDVH